MNIRDAKPKDLAPILELQKKCYQENAVRYHDNSIQPLTQTIDDLKMEFKEQLFLVAEKDSRIIGSVRAFSKNSICHIGKLIVHPDHQNKGIGTKLMHEIEKRFKKSLNYSLFTGYKDKKNIYLYEKLGYHIYNEKIIKKGLKLVYLEKSA